MLHIILGILKLIGIILLAVLLLILLVLLSLVFVPVRYRGRLKKTEEELAANLRLTWFLRMLSVEVQYEAENGKPVLKIRLFGISLEKLKEFAAKRKHKGQSKAEKQTAPETEQPEPGSISQETEQVNQEPAEQESGNKSEDTEPTEPDLTVQDIERVNQESVERESEEKTEDTEYSASQSENKDTETSFAQTRLDAENSSQSVSTPRPRITEKLRTFWNRLQAFFHRIADLIRHVIQLAQHTEEAAKAAAASAGKLWQKLVSLPERIESFLQFLEDYEVELLYHTVTGELLQMLSHYRPRRIKGWLRFGTGDPAQTGELTGVVYLLLPARAELEVRPEFHEAVFETEMEFDGRIRAVHVLRAGWRLLRDKKLKRLIAKIRKKPERGGKKEGKKGDLNNGR